MLKFSTETNEVLPGIFVCGRSQVTLERLETHKIRTIITVMGCRLEEKILSKVDKYHFFSCEDNMGVDLYSQFPNFVEWITGGLKNGSVLVHCAAGFSRSVSAVISYMVPVFGLTFEKSLAVIQQRRPQAGPNLGFRDQLRKWETKCLSKPWTASEAYLLHKKLILRRSRGSFSKIRKIVNKREGRCYLL